MLQFNNVLNKSIEEYRAQLVGSYIIPSHKILLEKIDVRFKQLHERGYRTMHDLAVALKTKKKVEQFAIEHNLPADYVTVLRRNVNSYIPKKRELKKMSIIGKELLVKLEKENIYNTEELYVGLQLNSKLNISNAEFLLLKNIVNLCQLRYVSESFCDLLLSSKYNSPDLIKTADSSEMLNELNRINVKGQFFNGKFGKNDMTFIIDDANFIGSSLYICSNY